jgi:hypothetical protein
VEPILETTSTRRMGTKTYMKRRRLRPGRTHSSYCHQKTPVLSTKSTKQSKEIKYDPDNLFRYSFNVSPAER